VIETSNFATDELASSDLLHEDPPFLLIFPASANFQNIPLKLGGVVVEG
jgi:hypothetical protein